MANFSDYLLTSALTGKSGFYVRLLNNSSGTSYISDTVTDVNGKFTFSPTSPPPGSYTVFYGLAATVPGTATATGDANYLVPVSAGDDAALKSLTVVASSPYNASAKPGSVVTAGVSPWFDITAYPNVDSTGVIDSTTGIQACLTAAQAAKGRVFGPPGSFKISATLTVTVAPITWEGVGPNTIFTAAGQTGFRLITVGYLASKTVLRNFALVGNDTVATVNAGINGGGNNGAQLNTDVLIENLEISKCGGNAIETGGFTQRWVVRNCHLHDNWNEGLFFANGAVNCKAEENIIHDNGYNGFDVNNSQTSSRWNYIYSNGNKAGITYVGVSDRNGIVLYSTGSALANCIIEDNYVYSNYVHGILVQSAGGNANTGHRIADNQCFSNGTTGNGYGDGISTNNASGVVGNLIIQGNVCQLNARAGILLYGSTQDIVSGNQCLTNGTGGSQGYGIAVQNNAATEFITGNMVIGTIGATSGAGIDVAAGCTDTWIGPNVLLSNAGGNLNDAGTRTTRFGNKANITDAFFRFDTGGIVATTLYLANTLTNYNNIGTQGLGIPATFGLDNRAGVSAVDGAPITLYAVPAGSNKLFRISSHLNATAFTSGTATYTITWTENGVAKTLAISTTALNTPAFGGQLVKPDQSTNITGQLTGVFVQTVTLAGSVEQLA